MISREINNIYHVGRPDDTKDSLGRHDVGYLLHHKPIKTPQTTEIK